MPIYEYKCPKCGIVEVTQSIKDAPLKKCPNCKSKVERMISSTSFVLKGSGWYMTDYAKKSTPAPENASASNGSATNGTASTADSASKPNAETKSAAPSDKAATTRPAAKPSD